ncbi:MAG: hypothetical protein AB3N24_18735 [Leisingera sp.]
MLSKTSPNSIQASAAAFYENLLAGDFEAILYAFEGQPLIYAFELLSPNDLGAAFGLLPQRTTEQSGKGNFELFRTLRSRRMAAMRLRSQNWNIVFNVR